MTVRYILSSVWVRLSIFSQLSIIQYVGLCVLSLLISLVMIEREYIYILCLIIIIKSEVWPITHRLGLGHETMVYVVCLSVFLLHTYRYISYIYIFVYIDISWYINTTFSRFKQRLIFAKYPSTILDKSISRKWLAGCTTRDVCTVRDASSGVIQGCVCRIDNCICSQIGREINKRYIRTVSPTYV